MMLTVSQVSSDDGQLPRNPAELTNTGSYIDDNIILQTIRAVSSEQTDYIPAAN